MLLLKAVSFKKVKIPWRVWDQGNKCFYTVYTLEVLLYPLVKVVVQNGSGSAVSFISAKLRSYMKIDNMYVRLRNFKSHQALWRITRNCPISEGDRVQNVVRL